MNNIVYKFLPRERVTYLKDELLRITQPGDLNDPFECLPAIPKNEVFIEVLKQVHAERIAEIEKGRYTKNERSKLKNLQLRRTKSEIRKIENEEEGSTKSLFVNRAIQKLNLSIGILSLTRRWDSTLMWSHYTNSHKGFCVGFNASDPFFKDYNRVANTSNIFMPVEYLNTRVQAPVTKGSEIDFNVMLRKSKDWEYEEEERLLVMLRNSHKKIEAKPYDIHLYKIPHLLIKEIIVGANTSKEDFNTIKTFCSEKTISIYQSKISEIEFDMERELCS